MKRRLDGDWVWKGAGGLRTQRGMVGGWRLGAIAAKELGRGEGVVVRGLGREEGR